MASAHGAAGADRRLGGSTGQAVWRRGADAAGGVPAGLGGRGRNRHVRRRATGLGAPRAAVHGPACALARSHPSTGSTAADSPVPQAHGADIRHLCLERRFDPANAAAAATAARTWFCVSPCLGPARACQFTLWARLSPSLGRFGAASQPVASCAFPNPRTSRKHSTRAKIGRPNEIVRVFVFPLRKAEVCCRVVSRLILRRDAYFLLRASRFPPLGFPPSPVSLLVLAFYLPTSEWWSVFGGPPGPTDDSPPFCPIWGGCEDPLEGMLWGSYAGD
jgi:hypothetical protein